MRKLFVLAMVGAMVGLGGFARDASAGSTVDIMFVGVNGGAIAATNTVTAGPGTQLTMALLMRTDQPLTIAIFSLQYDLDLDDELDFVTFFQWSGVATVKAGSDFFAPLNDNLTTTNTTHGSYQGSTTNFGLPRTLPPNGGAFAGGYQMGTVIWKVNAGVNTDGADILSGLLSILDGWYDSGFNAVTGLQFNSATVNFVPEPGTASLLGLGLVGLMLMGRRNRS